MTHPWHLRAWLAVWHAPGAAASALMRTLGLAWSALMAADIAKLSILIAAGGGMAWTLVAVGYFLKVHERLSSDQLFWIVVGAHVLVMVALIIIGRREFSASLSRQGLNLNVGAEDEPVAKITTTTEVSAAQPTEAAPPWERKS